MDWDKLRIFHAVASAGSFTHAGQSLGLSQSAVSRQISALEEEISTPLFQRHARGLTLTDEGELLFTAVTDVLSVQIAPDRVFVAAVVDFEDEVRAGDVERIIAEAEAELRKSWPTITSLYVKPKAGAPGP